VGVADRWAPADRRAGCAAEGRRPGWASRGLRPADSGRRRGPRGSGDCGERGTYAMLRAMHPPSVDALTRLLSARPDCAGLPRPLLVDAARQAIAAHDRAAEGAADATVERAALIAVQSSRGLLRPVINATGTLLHTNLGRAPILPRTSAEANDRWRASNLEFDLASGTRGSRRTHASSLLARLCGAESALVVNNCAAAVMLVLAALGRPHEHGEVLVSRGELVEIGGGFRIPDVLEQSGCRLVEVGTTNRTRRRDYERAITEQSSLILVVHRSNYTISGFTESASIEELSTLGVPVVADIGSGLVDEQLTFLADASGRAPAVPWLDGEPGARQTLARGATVAIFSGDKLFGGPQAGIIVGTREHVDACAAHPFARALRPGGLVLEALQDIALAYLRGEAAQLPFWTMALTSIDGLQQRAIAIANAIGDRAEAVPCTSVPGGGTLPHVEIASFGVRVPESAAAALRHRSNVPIVARVVEGACVLDLRTVDPHDDPEIVSALKGVLA
jgi:L-seryl-tRNA(Ser) seleniumtransferase